jgi:hypothetical protein
MDAYVISGFRRNGNGKVFVGVLFSENPPTMAAVKGMGFTQFEVDRATIADAKPVGFSLYLFERSPSAKEVTIIGFNGRGDLLKGKTLKRGRPIDFLPKLKGDAVARLIIPRGEPTHTDLEKLLEKRRAGNGGKPHKRFAPVALRAGRA